MIVKSRCNSELKLVLKVERVEKITKLIEIFFRKVNCLKEREKGREGKGK